MKHFLELYTEHLGRYRQQLLQGKVSGGLNEGALAFVAAATSNLFSHSLLVVVPSNAEAEALAEEAKLFQKAEKVLFLPGYESIPYSYGQIGVDIVLKRAQAVDRLRSGESLLIFTSINALLRKTIRPKEGRELSIECAVGKTIPPLQLLRRLISYGYKRVERIGNVGEVCLKGSVLDLFAINYARPLRLNWFDDLIENIRFFDLEGQQSYDELLSKVRIIPVGEITIDEKESALLLEALQERQREIGGELPAPVLPVPVTEGETSKVLSQLDCPGLEELFALTLPSCSLLELFPQQPLTFIYPAAQVKESIARIRREFDTLYKRHREERICLPPEQLLDDFPENSAAPLLWLSPYGRETYNAEEQSKNIFGISDNSLLRGNISELRDKAAELLNEGCQIFITSSYPAQMRRISAIFRKLRKNSLSITEDPLQLQYDPRSPKLHLFCSPWRRGFSVPQLGFYLLTDMEIFGRSYKSRNRFKRVDSDVIGSFLDLKEGDYVVHLIHGIARFAALERVCAMGKERDFLILQYAGQDRLYVPIDQISMIQRYISSVERPRLDSLGKASFRRVRQRVEERVEQFAQELLKLYATRISRRGYQYPPDTVWQEEFEAAFTYEETPDQIAATEDVKKDMETPRPMNRLICGDVGYGKTEVAIRAAFKAIMAGRQVAFVAPTTILALQHLRTLQERFQNYPINVDWVSRFRSHKDIRIIKEKLLKGDVDMVVGTHALFAADMRLPNLGLLIIDEEQRFGVVHKEAIKRLRSTVDTLTISATPIPRSLHMALVGIHDLSIIKTPPMERKSIETYVMEDRDSIIFEAIQREIGRGGQIFYLHNRINTIEAAALRLQQLVPDVSIATLHGRMPKEQIEDILLQFQERGIDLLVTTTIIENGIDMPNVNTLIIDRADSYGLAQLYQIRGRVGRSARQAYAYLLYSPATVLSETAQNRLNAIFEYQELGSGFKVAMRDLEIRGAGNVLGREQSGHIADVGYELYVKLLNEAVARLKGLPPERDVRCSINLPVDFYLPQSYIPDIRQRIELYKRFEAAGEEDAVSELAKEMCDRFGPLPAAAETFVLIEHIRTLAQKAGFQSLYADRPDRVEMTAGEYFQLSAQSLISCLSEKRGLELQPSRPNMLFFRPQVKENCLEELAALLRYFASLKRETVEQGEQQASEAAVQRQASETAV